MVKNIISKIELNYWLVAILIFSTVLRLYNLGFQSVWLDEIHTMVETDPKLSYKEFYDILFLRELMPHLYYIIGRVFSFVFGHSVIVVRLISVIAGILGVYAIYLLGKELISKKVGLVAALFLSVNHFHIYYSQEARPYALLTLFAILSFLHLLKFLKKRNLKSIIYYGLFAGLMINTHFFGLFVLASQVLILLIQLIVLPIRERKRFFIDSLIVGIIIVLLFIPSLPILFRISSVKSFWIPPPSDSFYRELFRVLFGKSEFLIYTALLLIIIYFFKVFSEKGKFVISSENKGYTSSFVILIVWLFTIFMIPYIRSYTNVPMLINRYFICALPPILLILSIGLVSSKSNIVVFILSLIFTMSSLVNLFLVKGYYHKITKTQFREITSEISTKNINKDPIIYRKAWQMEYFFNKDEIELVNSTLDNYVDRLGSRSEKLQSFWAVGAHINPYKVKPKNESFLKKNFHLIDEIEYKDCWAKYYIVKGNNSTKTINLNLVDFKPKLSRKNSELIIKSNGTISSDSIFLDKGRYRLSIKTKSKPFIPINNENAHLDVSIDGKRIGGFFTSSKKIETTLFNFKMDKDKHINVQLTFGNDFFTNKKDRDLIIYGVSIEKLGIKDE